MPAVKLRFLLDLHLNSMSIYLHLILFWVMLLMRPILCKLDNKPNILLVLPFCSGKVELTGGKIDTPIPHCCRIRRPPPPIVN